MLRFRCCRLTWILLVCSLAWGSPPSVEAQSGKLYVTNSAADDITVIDLASLTVIGNINVGAHVHGVAAQADGRRLFTTVESDKTLKIIDTASDQIIDTIKLTGRPNQCAVTPDGRYVAVPIRDGDSVDIVEVVQRRVVKVLPVKMPHNAFGAGSNRYLFVSSMGSNEIDMIDLVKMEYAAHIPVGGVPRPFVVSSDGRRMYVALSNLHGFVIVNIPEKALIQRVEIPAEHPQPHPRPFEPATTLTHGLALSPDQKELWVTSLLDDSLYVYDLETEKVSGRIATGEGPNWVAFSPDDKYVCVSNTDGDDVSIIEVRTRREVARLKVGKAPKRLVVTNAPVAGFVRTRGKGEDERKSVQ